MQCLLGPLVIACVDERLVSLSSARFSRNVRPKVADNVAAFLDVGRRSAAALTIQEVGAAPLDLEQRSVVNGRLVELAGMLRNQLADHFEMAEFLDRDVLEHVADAGVFDVKRLHPILQSRGQFARGSSELLKKVCPEASIGSANVDRLNQFFAMEKHAASSLSKTWLGPEN